MKIKHQLLLLCIVVGNAFATPTTPTSDFIDNNDGTVTHKTTGLTWMRCALGQAWTGATCSGSTKIYTYAGALALTRTFAGTSDWRLPNIAELQTIVERENIRPAINKTLFPSTPSNAFWSSSPSVGYFYYAWYVNFYNGYVSYLYRYNRYAVRLVRASQSLAIGLATPNSEFTDNQDGTVTHKRTGLQWQRCAVGQTWTGSTCSSSGSEYTYDDTQKVTSNLAGYSDWRVPNANELATIVSYDKKYPSINLDQFPNTPNNLFWSSSPHVNDSDLAGYVYFDHGSVGYTPRSYGLPVRLVRASQPSVIDSPPDTTVDLSTTYSQSNSRVKTNENLTYTATLTNNGTGAASNTKLLFYLPPRNVTTVSMPSDCAVVGKSITCTIGDLAAGASVTRAITVYYTKSGGASSSSLALTDSNDSNSANNMSRVVTAIMK